MPWLVAQLSLPMRRNIGIVKDSSFAASNAEQKIFMTMSLMAWLVVLVFFWFISVHQWWREILLFQIGCVWCRRYHVVWVLLFIALEQKFADRIVLEYFLIFAFQLCRLAEHVRLSGFINLFAHSCEWLLL